MAEVTKSDNLHENSNELPRLDGVVCDFSLVNRRWEKKVTRLTTKTTRAQATISKANVMKISKQSPDVSPAMKYEFAKEQAEADDDIAASRELLEELEEQLEALLLFVIVDISPANLSPDAPKALNWDELDSFGWLTDFQAIATEIMAQRQDMREAKKK